LFETVENELRHSRAKTAKLIEDHRGEFEELGLYEVKTIIKLISHNKRIAMKMGLKNSYFFKKGYMSKKVITDNLISETFVEQNDMSEATISEKIEKRKEVSPKEFDKILKKRRESHAAAMFKKTFEMLHEFYEEDVMLVTIKELASEGYEIPKKYHKFL
jgi:hypothetical protein